MVLKKYLNYEPTGVTLPRPWTRLAKWVRHSRGGRRRPAWPFWFSWSWARRWHGMPTEAGPLPRCFSTTCKLCPLRIYLEKSINWRAIAGGSTRVCASS